MPFNTAPEKKESLWSKDFTKIGVSNLLTCICMQALLNVFPLFLNMKGFSASTVGTVASLYTISAMIMRFTAGNLIDRNGRRKVGLIGAILLTVSLICILTASLFSDTLSQTFSFSISDGTIISLGMIIIIAMRMVQGLGFSAVTISNSTMVADVLPRARFAEGIGYYNLFNYTATAVGPALGIALIGFSVDLTFGLLLIIMVLTLVVVNSLRYENDPSYLAMVQKGEGEEEEKYASDTRGIWRLFEKKAIPASIILLLLAISAASVQDFLTLYATSAGLAGIGFYFTIQAVFMALARLISGKMAKLGAYKSIFIGLAIIGVGFFGLSFVKNIWMLYVCAAIYGFGAGIAFPMLQVLTLSGVSRARRGTANSTYLASWDIGAGIGAAVWGYTIDIAGFYSIIYSISAVVIVADLVLVLIFSKKFPSEY